MDSFEKLLEKERSFVERFVRFRLNAHADAEDVLQETYVAAYQKFSQLKKESSFKAWIISIARNKCNDYFRQKAEQLEIPIEELNEKIISSGRYGRTEGTAVRETLDLLRDKDKQILYLYFWKELPQVDIAKLLNIPIGTVKSRLYNAKQNFKNKYPYYIEVSKGENIMKKMPKFMPEYIIEKSNHAPFEVRHEELPGMFIIPRLGESLIHGSYDFPEKKITHITKLKTIRKVNIHSIEGVEIEKIDIEGDTSEKCTIFAQLTEKHCRYLGGVSETDGIWKITTFLDDDFNTAYEIGEDNTGFDVYRIPQGKIIEQEGELLYDRNGDISDICGRYTVTINGKSYDTVRLIDIEEYKGIMLCEYYLDKNGRTVLWRRFNSDDWAIDRYKNLWSEQLPENEKIVVNGTIFVHWYDCITEYVL